MANNIVNFPPSTDPATEAVEVEAAQSAIVRDCIVFAQCMAAWNAGDAVDSVVTGNSDYEKLGDDYQRRAKQALKRLSRISDNPISREELCAKAMVLKRVIGDDYTATSLEQYEVDFIRSVAVDIVNQCRADRQ